MWDLALKTKTCLSLCDQKIIICPCETSRRPKHWFKGIIKPLHCNWVSAPVNVFPRFHMLLAAALPWLCLTLPCASFGGKKKKKKKKKLHRPYASSANKHKLAFLGRCSKFVFPIKAQPNNFFQILFQQCNCIHNLQLWAKFQGNIPSEKWFSHFGRKFYVAR